MIKYSKKIRHYKVYSGLLENKKTPPFYKLQVADVLFDNTSNVIQYYSCFVGTEEELLDYMVEIDSDNAKNWSEVVKTKRGIEVPIEKAKRLLDKSIRGTWTINFVFWGVPTKNKLPRKAKKQFIERYSRYYYHLLKQKPNGFKIVTPILIEKRRRPIIEAAIRLIDKNQVGIPNISFNHKRWKKNRTRLWLSKTNDIAFTSVGHFIDCEIDALFSKVR